MSLSVLPREIADLIVDQLDFTKSPLGPLLFISPIFRAASREYIFRHVSLFVEAETNSGRPKYGVLLEAIQGDRDILKSIKELTIQMNSGDATSMNPSQAKILTQLLQLLTAAPIRRWELFGYPLFDFSILPPDVAVGLISIRSLPSLRTVVFESLGYVTPTLATGSSIDDPITSLDISNIYFINVPQPKEIQYLILKPPRPCPYAGLLQKEHQFRALQYLKLSRPAQFLASFAGPYNFSSTTNLRFPALKELTIEDVVDCYGVEGSSDADAVATLVTASPLLESLSFNSHRSFPVIVAGAFPHLYESICEGTSLRTLNLCWPQSNYYIAPYIRLLARFLEGVALSSIRTVSVSFVWYVGEPRALADEDDLEEMQSVLFRMRDALKQMVSLKRVTLTLEFEPSCLFRDDAVAPIKAILDGISLGDGVAFEYVLITSGC